MSITHNFSFGHTGGSAPLADAVAVQGELATEANIALAGAATNQQENIAFNHTNLRGVYIKSDQDVTLKTNSSGSPDNTITIKAGIPFVWVYQSGITNPFSAAVTTTYWTNAGSAAATIFMRTLVS